MSVSARARGGARGCLRVRLFGAERTESHVSRGSHLIMQGQRACVRVCVTYHVDFRYHVDAGDVNAHADIHRSACRGHESRV